MGWFGRKDEARAAVPRELIVMGDLMRYFRGKGWGPGDAVYLTAWTCGFMTGSIIGAGGVSAESEKGQKLIGQTHGAVEDGIKAALEAQDPELVRDFLAVGGQL